jgi:hypothetical protein
MGDETTRLPEYLDREAADAAWAKSAEEQLNEGE